MMRSFPRVRGFYVPLHHQSHHLIPVGVFSRVAFASDFGRLRGDGFDVSSFMQNGMFLPSTEAAAMRSRMPLHRGPHRRYNDLVAHRVAAILKDMNAGRPCAGACRDAVQRLQILTAALRTALYRRAPFMALNQRDPFATHVDFSDLDAVCDILWSATN